MERRNAAIGVPHIQPGPWTREARELAIRREVREAYLAYFRKAVKTRNWSPWDDLPLKEMARYGSSLSADTVTIIEGFLGVEDFIGDYVTDGLKILRFWHDRRNLQLQWGAEEAKHAESWALVLLHSGVRTEAQIEDYRRRVAERVYRLGEDQPGLDEPLGGVIYTMLQERATFFNYDEMRRRIRAEYGLPEQPTPDERARGTQIGAAGAFKIVANDEIAHHGIFLRIVEIYKTYLPHETLDLLARVIRGFGMPALDLLPNEDAFKAAVERTRLVTPIKFGRAIANPILDCLGFENRRALERAVQATRILPPGLGPQELAIGRNGELVLSTAG